MSYPRDLNEIGTAELKGELDRRFACLVKGTCAYCGRRLYSEPDCKMREQHRLDPEGE